MTAQAPPVDALRESLARVRSEVGKAVVGQAEREVVLVARSLVRLACQAFDRKLRGRVSVEFAAACVAIVGLPWPFLRVRNRARRLAG